jgi:amidohydrolase
MTCPALTSEELESLIEFRRELHRNPELSNQEERTSARIADLMQALSPDAMITGLGGHGVAAVFNGAAPGETMLIRCELDALPIQEISEAPHRSDVAGKAHLCGHDGHMAILCAVARRLSARRPSTGRAVLLFQPAEETGDGAKAVTSDPRFAEIQPDFAFALHNLPGVELGHVWIKQGPFACASRGACIRFTGRVAHSSQPETGVSPVGALSDFLRDVQALSRGTVGDEGFTLVTVCHARMGEPSYGVLPGEAEVRVTLRTARNDAMAALARDCEALAQRLASRDGLTLDVSYAEDFKATVNDPQAVAIVESALEDIGASYSIMNAPMRWSEDFGVFGATARSAMFGVGSGIGQPALHNPDYDFPDALIQPASGIFVRILENRLG